MFFRKERTVNIMDLSWSQIGSLLVFIIGCAAGIWWTCFKKNKNEK